MRMVWTYAPDEDFFPARDRLVDAFERWARRAGRGADLFVAEVLIEQRWSVGDGLLGRWQPDDLRYALLEYFPRTVTTTHWSEMIATVHTFVDFLFDADLADAKCADASVLHAALDALSVDFDAAMADETRFGPAKYWSMRMLAAGVNIENEAEIAAFMTDVQHGRVPVDEAVLARVVENQLTDDDESLLPLPPFDPPTPEALTAVAAGSVALDRLLRFTAWVGDGRALTPKGNLKLADAAELITLLGLSDRFNAPPFKVRSSEELYETNVVFAWAKEARFVRVVKGRVLPNKSAARTLKDPAAAARRAFEAFFAVGRAVAPPGYLDSIVPYRFDEFAFALLMAMFMAQRPIDAEERSDIVNGLIDEFFDPDPDGIFDPVHERDVDLMLTQLDLFGAVRHDEERTTLTPFGAALFVEHLRGEDITVPTFDDLLAETAEFVVALAAETPTIAATLLTRWRDHRPETGAAELRALADRTDDPEHRALAETYGGVRRAPARPHAVSARRPKKRPRR
ncbi:hypothetical protein [Catenuloplanes japonicus]|uniref:hypothetical protein n=1 Tax=Catenuloplanes japonicus TaxID=33876 RepID=UPI000524A316|nr:hypothetical protein [Catenuloplanes japonicus]